MASFELVDIPLIPLTLRNKIRKIQKKEGQKKFFKKLQKIDPLSASLINPTDTQRSIRAYEVMMFTKKSILEWYKGTKSIYKNKDFHKIIINYPRQMLIKRIQIRTRLMLEMGVIQEVKRFFKLNIAKNKSISKAIGVNEIKEFLKKMENKELLVDKISIKTRQYAKRQMTWARGHMKTWKKINPKQLNNFLKNI